MRFSQGGDRMTSEKAFYFDKIFKDAEEYQSVKDQLKQDILNDYGSRNNKAVVIIGTENVPMTLGKVLVNLLVMKPLVGKGIKLEKGDLFSFNTVTESSLNQYFNRIITRNKVAKTFDFDNLRAVIAETINEMSDISGEINVLSGSSITFYDFVRLYATDEEARDIFSHKLDAKLQFDEIEDKFNALGKKIEAYFKKQKDSDLYPFIASETGINKKQLTQAIGFVGLKPDIDGEIIPIAIPDNYLTGLRNLESYYINSKGTRKALITNAKQVRKSGYLTRKLSLGMIDRYHDNNIEDCGTIHYVNFEVSNEKKLKQIEGRHYYIIDADGTKTSKTLHTVSVDDKDLIGKKIGLRSPVTCSSKNVCRTCYGRELSEINKDLNTGLISVLLLTNPLTQKLLSAKHLLTTKSEKIEWGEKFLELFTINMNSVNTLDTEVTISINKSDIKYDEDEAIFYIDDQGFGKDGETKKTVFEIFQNNKKVMDYNLPISLIIDKKIYEDGIEESDDENKVLIVTKNYVDEDFPLFTFYAKNNELTKSLQQILDLIESSDHLTISDYHRMVNKFSDLLIENELNFINSVHSEMIVSILIKDAETGKRLDFSKENLNEYNIVRVSKSVMNAPLSVSLAFERLNDQLIDLETYNKDGESLMDHLFK
jgi:hypothetical protein